MASWDLGALARAAEGQSPGGGLPNEVQAVGTDTRSLPPGSLFVALRGERFDGHAFLSQARDAGAVAAVVDERGATADAPLPLIVVDDTLTALGRIARHIRRLHAGPVVGITGSNGKTTTKELVARAISPRGEPHKTKGNLNNRIGVPLTLFDWKDEWAAVVEMGMNERGEIADLTRIAEPDVGLITLVGPAHIENLGSLENIARAKGELYEHLSPDAVAIVNADDPLVQSIAAPLLGAQRRIRFGRDAAAEVRVLQAAADEGGVAFELEVEGRRRWGRIPLPGVHNAMNAASAVAVALALEVDLAAAINALETVVLPGARSVVRRDVGPGVSILDDSYNANPQSMEAAFATLASLSGGRTIAVVGDMLELGAQARTLHRVTGEAAVRHGIEWVLALGDFAEAVAEGASGAGGRGDAFSTMESLLAALDAELRPGDWLVVKGSRGMRMERVVEHLEGRGA